MLHPYDFLNTKTELKNKKILVIFPPAITNKFQAGKKMHFLFKKKNIYFQWKLAISDLAWPVVV